MSQAHRTRAHAPDEVVDGLAAQDRGLDHQVLDGPHQHRARVICVEHEIDG